MRSCVTGAALVVVAVLYAAMRARVASSCSVAEVSLANASCELFAKSDVPLIVRGAYLNPYFVQATTRSSLQARTDLRVGVSTANTRTGRESTEYSLAEYVKSKHLDEIDYSARGVETSYLFGGHSEGNWDEFLAAYTNPYVRCFSQTTKAFGVAGKNSGVPFHFHGPGFLQVVHGNKRWFLYPPGSHINEFESESVGDDAFYFWTRRNTASFECSLGQADVIYFPDRWMHGTLNTAMYNVFVATFV